MSIDDGERNTGSVCGGRQRCELFGLKVSPAPRGKSGGAATARGYLG